MGHMHEREMKSLHLVVGNGIRKRWPFVGSLRPHCESHDSRIFTVPPVTGLVKSQHTSLRPSRPWAGLRPHSVMQRCFFSLFQPRCPATPSNMEAHGGIRGTCAYGSVRLCLCLHIRAGGRVGRIKANADCLQDQWISGQFILWMSLWRAFIPRRFHELYNKWNCTSGPTSDRGQINIQSCYWGVFYLKMLLTGKGKQEICEMMKSDMYQGCAGFYSTSLKVFVPWQS